MSELLLYAQADQLNDATRWYLATLGRATGALGYPIRHVTRLSEVGARDKVLVVECKSAFKLALLRPKARAWLWMQGVFPEEARLHFNSPARERLWRLFERVSLPRLRGVVMVSQAMRQHFERRYPAWRGPAFVLPCVNAAIDPDSFAVPGKYTRPTFVYAGSLHEWQCVATTLDVFKRFQARCPEARLSLFTKDIDHARQLVAAQGLADVEVAHLSMQQLNARLSGFKYGFVLRQEHVVNRVATPTKVSSYMAAGVIPVMTRAVQDYTDALARTQPLVMSERLDAQLIADDLLKQEAQTIAAADVLDSYRRVFNDYFDHSRYQPGLQSFFERSGLLD